MSEGAAAKQDHIVTAALGVFCRHGYRRTSMDLIARAARMSRPAVYQYFGGKEEIFRAAGEKLVADIVTGARAVWGSGDSVADRLYGMLAIKLDLVAGSVEARLRAELLAEAREVAGDVVLALEEGCTAVVEAALEAASDELDLVGHAIPAHDAAAVLVASLAGIAQQEAPPEVLHTRLRQLVDLTVRGLTSRTPAPAMP
ncbi:TetR/AcrR family transcriptional regulator [Nonomuraea sp. SBT364]|uniref:TetR/AcrR family transcriptional regulator n=1 Tax=Nonomuraea sp. SBT364 TaxID=1580530 RepID=UPI00066D717C|nr:TetR/AcrR family transcriptional regulator [Nonomuraea sp. SBT364]